MTSLETQHPVEGGSIAVDVDTSTIIDEPLIDEELEENEDLELDSNIPDQTNSPPRIEGWKRALRCEILWLGVVNLALIWALIWDSKSDCSGHHLKTWIYVMVPLQFIMSVPNGLLQLYMPHLYRSAERRRLHNAGFFYLTSRLLNFFWVAWALTGIVWTFQSKSCAESIPVVYTVCYILAVMNTIFIGFPVLVCCCTLPGTLLVYLCCPSVFGIKKIRKASPRLIKKVTTSKKFSDSLQIPKEDSNCAICLSDYADGEEIRFLHCGHHFHSDCIMEWLVKNMTCPFCKKEIDKKEEKQKEKEPAQIESDDDEVPLHSEVADRAALLV